MTNAKYTEAKIHVGDLDVLRGLAAVLMIVNHLGVTTLAPAQADHGLTGSLLFIGSFAPVLFFFITGVGYGIQSSQKKGTSRWPVIANKAIILLLADLLMQWSRGRIIGLDFLGFIGFSVLLLEIVRKLKRPLLFCTIGILTTFILRYLAGPLVRAIGYDQQSFLMNWILGTVEVPNVSYPLSPWVTYPLLGYLIGTATIRYWSSIAKRRWVVALQLALLGLVPLSASILLFQRGTSFFRWGTVGLGFYVASFVAMLFGLALALLICTDVKFVPLKTFLPLQGVASLAVVPIHYCLIDTTLILGGKNLNLFAFYAILLITLALSFLLSKLVGTVSDRIRQIKQQQRAWVALTVAVFLLSCVTFITGQVGYEIWSLLPRTVGQILLCLLLSVQLPSQPRLKFST